MSVDRNITLLRIKKEIVPCLEYGSKCGWIFSDIDESDLSFLVKMKSPVDDEEYQIEVILDDYPELPPFLDFIEIDTGKKGTKKAYPKSRDSFFHPTLPCICNPCSRKSYKSFNNGAPHQDWNMIGWQQNSKVRSLTNLEAILKAIYLRICIDGEYLGRMEK